MPKSTVIVPTYNEAQNIERLVQSVLAQSPDLSLLIIDDNSPDGTGKIARRLATGERRLQVIHRTRKSGLGSAYREGFAYLLSAGRSKYLLEMDADFSHNPGMLPVMINTAESEKAALVIGSRYVAGGAVEGWNRRRLFLSSTANMLCSFLLGRRVRDYTAGFRCYRADALARLDLGRIGSEGYAFQVQMTFEILRRRMKVTEMPISFAERRSGVSKFGGGIVAEAVVLLALLFLKRLIT